MARKARLLQLSRKVHLYFGLFISPALVFFAITGAYQTLGLHEPASDYKPASILATLGQLHKKQTTVLPVRRNGGPGQGTAGSAIQAPRGQNSPESAALPSQGPKHRPESAAPTVERTGSEPSRLRDSQAQPIPTELKNAAPAAESTSQPGSATRSQGAQPTPPTLRAKQKQHLPMKIFFVLVSFGLLVSTVTGVYMAYKYDRNWILVTGLLLAGVLVPLLLLRF